MFLRLSALAISASLLGANPALAQAPASSNQIAGDPNERICEDIKMTGSRLAKKRFCGTRSEWADKRLQDKQEVERIQRSPCVYQGNSASGKPSC